MKFLFNTYCSPLNSTKSNKVHAQRARNWIMFHPFILILIIADIAPGSCFVLSAEDYTLPKCELKKPTVVIVGRQRLPGGTNQYDTAQKGLAGSGLISGAHKKGKSHNGKRCTQLRIITSGSHIFIGVTTVFAAHTVVPFGSRLPGTMSSRLVIVLPF